jgi:hypothetical protein
MATTLLPPDFKEFLKLLNIHAVEYLLVGGHAVLGFSKRKTSRLFSDYEPILQRNSSRYFFLPRDGRMDT